MLSDAAWLQLIGRVDPVILDVGANDGEDSLRFLRLFPQARIVCFEPDERALHALRTALLGRAVIVPAAASSVDGLVPFWPSGGRPRGVPLVPLVSPGGWNKSGSTKQPTGHLAMHPWCEFGTPITVDAVRLDTWIRPCTYPAVDLLWADVQGAELDLISGARELLRRTRFFYTEYSNQALYAGQPTLVTIQQALPDFELAEVFQFDALFRNTKDVHHP